MKEIANWKNYFQCYATQLYSGHGSKCKTSSRISVFPSVKSLGIHINSMHSTFSTHDGVPVLFLHLNFRQNTHRHKKKDANNRIPWNRTAIANNTNVFCGRAISIGGWFSLLQFASHNDCANDFPSKFHTFWYNSVRMFSSLIWDFRYFYFLELANSVIISHSAIY